MCWTPLKISDFNIFPLVFLASAPASASPTRAPPLGDSGLGGWTTSGEKKFLFKKNRRTYDLTYFFQV